METKEFPVSVILNLLIFMDKIDSEQASEKANELGMAAEFQIEKNKI